MVEWKELGEVCEIKGRIGFRGYTREDQVDKGEGAISLSPGNINNGSMNYDSCTYITWEKYEESPEIIVNEGDIILCKTASVGKVARIRYLPEKATINPQLVLIKEIKTNPQYLYYVLYDNPFQAKIKGLAGVGSVPNVSQAKLASIQIPIPSLSEQERIVGILDTFTAAIENLKAQIANRRKQYEHYRDQLLDLEGKEGVEMKTLGEILQIKKGEYITKKEANEGIYPVILGGKEPAYYIDKYNHTGKAIVISRSGASAGYVSLWNEPIFVTDGFLIEPKGNVVFEFMYYILKSKQRYLQNTKKGGAIPHITPSLIESIDVILPSLSEQSRIVSILDTFEASIANLEAQLKEREKQYEYYRNKLLSF